MFIIHEQISLNQNEFTENKNDLDLNWSMNKLEIESPSLKKKHGKLSGEKFLIFKCELPKDCGGWVDWLGWVIR